MTRVLLPQGNWQNAQNTLSRLPNVASVLHNDKKLHVLVLLSGHNIKHVNLKL